MPEINGNPPPVTKRKKNREHEKKQQNLEFNLPQYNVNSFSNLNVNDGAYYPMFNHSMPAEPMSLPIYPVAYPNFHHPFYFNPPNKPMIPNGDLETSEYMSLPPVISLDQNDNNSKRRFSDPGLNNDSDTSSSSLESRLIHKLSQQVNSLKESNRKLMKDVLELRMEFSMLKQQQNSRYYEREYEPGMLADVIREVRDAARVREDTLMARVKHMIEEKQLSMSQLHLVSEKNRNNDRILKLEEQMKNMSMTQRSEESFAQGHQSAIEDGTSSARQVLELEREALLLRRELQEARAKKEESDQRLLQLDKKLSAILRQSADTSTYDGSEDGKTTTADNYSITSSSLAQMPALPPKVTLSGPVTDL